MNCEPEFCPKCHDKKQKVYDTDQHPHNVNSCSSYYWCAKCLVETTSFGADLDVIIYLHNYNSIQSNKMPKGYSDEHWYCENCDNFLSWDDYRDADGEYM